MSQSTDRNREDRILPLTRLTALVVLPILLLAFLILYLFPEQSGQRFAWEIKPNMTALYMGAGYLGGAYLFLRVILERRWHRIAAGFLPVSAFTVSMLLITVIHWGRFDLGHFPFQLWLILYVVTPLLIPWLWLRNRSTDSGEAEEYDAVVPEVVRWGVRVLGILLLLVSAATMIWPQVLSQPWPWQLTPLTARVLAGWGMLLGVADIAIANDPRWSAWRIGVQSITLWHLLVLVGAPFHRADFSGGNLANWYLVSVVLVLVAIAALYVWMEAQRRPRQA